MNNITLIISSLNSGGAERVMSELANYWVTQGHQVSLVTLASPKSQPFYPLDSRIKLIQLDQSTSESSTFIRFKNIVKRIWYLRKAIENLNSNVIISFMDTMNITTLIAALSLKKSIIVSVRTHPTYHKLPALYEKLRQLLYPRANQVVVQTQSIADCFNNFKNISIIPNAVTVAPVNKADINKSVNSKHIISVGRLCPFKGFDTLISSFTHLLHHHPHLNLTIYGEGDERSNLERLIVSLGLQGKVSLPGTTKNVHKALMNADLFIFPSKYEGFPNALGEAMAVGLPVIASNCSGNIDIVRDKIDGRLFPVGDVEALTRVALELLNDPVQCQLLATNARTITERFSPEHIFSLWDQALHKALKSRSF